MWCALLLPDAADDGSPISGRPWSSWDFTLLFLRFLFVSSCDRGRRSSACAFVFRFPLFHAAIPRGLTGIWGFLGDSAAILLGFFARGFRRRRVFPSSQQRERRRFRL
jgi:hypothetical protein